MKLMYEQDMLDVVEADSGSRETLFDRMAFLWDGKTPDWLQDGVRAGRFKVTEVRMAGKPVVVLWWWFCKAETALVINAAASLVKHDVSNAMFDGVEQLGRQIGATQVRFQTCRRGLVAKSKKAGYHAEAIVMSKNL